VNRGRFTPGEAGSDRLLQDSDHDIIAGLAFLAAQPQVAAGQLGIVGASYSGEFAALAARTGGLRIAAFAFLSPGSLSPESIRWLERSERPWLFVASRQERAAATREVTQLVVDSTHQADILLVAAAGHATALLRVVSVLPATLAAWLSDNLRMAATTAPLPAN
jgi:dienelactone hydrolase